MDVSSEEFGFDSSKAKAYAMAKLIKVKLEELAIPVNDRHFEQLVKRVEDYLSKEDSELNIPQGISKAAKALGYKGPVTINLEGLSDAELESLYLESSSELHQKIQMQESQKIYREWEKEEKINLRIRHKENKQFLAQHSQIWGRTLDILEHYFLICLNLGIDFNSQVRPTMSSQDFLLEALIRSHARACPERV